MDQPSIYPFEFKRGQRIGKITGYSFFVFDNYRKSNGDLGDIACYLCGSQSSVLLSVFNECDPGDMIVCKGCLDKMCKLIDWGYMEQIKKGRRDGNY